MVVDLKERFYEKSE